MPGWRPALCRKMKMQAIMKRASSAETEKRLMAKIESGYVELVPGAGLGLVSSAHRAEQCG